MARLDHGDIASVRDVSMSMWDDFLQLFTVGGSPHSNGIGLNSAQTAVLASTTAYQVSTTAISVSSAALETCGESWYAVIPAE